MLESIDYLKYSEYSHIILRQTMGVDSPDREAASMLPEGGKFTRGVVSAAFSLTIIILGSRG